MAACIACSILRLPRCVGLWADTRALMRAPASAKSPTQSSALCRRNSSGQRRAADGCVVFDDHRVVERTPFPARLRHGREPLPKAERPGARELAYERLARHTIASPLAADRMLEVDRHVQLELRRRHRRVGRAVARHFHRPAEREVRDRPRVLHDPGVLDRLHERRRAAVHDRRLQRVQLDLHVVHAAAEDGCQDVLRRVDRHRISPELGAIVRRNRHTLERGDHRLIGQVHSAEYDARSTRRGLEGYATCRAVVHSDSLE